MLRGGLVRHFFGGNPNSSGNQKLFATKSPSTFKVKNTNKKMLGHKLNIFHAFLSALVYSPTVGANNHSPLYFHYTSHTIGNFYSQNFKPCYKLIFYLRLKMTLNCCLALSSIKKHIKSRLPIPSRSREGRAGLNPDLIGEPFNLLTLTKYNKNLRGPVDIKGLL